MHRGLDPWVFSESSRGLIYVLICVWGILVLCFTGYFVEKMHAKQVLNKKNDITLFTFYCVNTLKILSLFYSSL